MSEGIQMLNRRNKGPRLSSYFGRPNRGRKQSSGLEMSQILKEGTKNFQVREENSYRNLPTDVLVNGHPW